MDDFYNIISVGHNCFILNITLNNKIYFVEFDVPNFPKATNVKYNLNNNPLFNFKPNIAEDLDFREYLTKFIDCLKNSKETQCFNTKKFQNFLKEIIMKKFPSQTFCFLIESDILKVSYKQNKMLIKISHKNDDQFTYEVISHTFPEKDNLFDSTTDFMQLNNQFRELGNKLEPFYKAMQDIDDMCSVIDPAKPSSKVNYRRIVIDREVSLQILFDPWNVSERPTFRFFGPQNNKSIFEQKLEQNFENWDEDLDFTTNLLRILDLPYFLLEDQMETKDSDDDLLYSDKTDCRICYTSDLDNQKPDVQCKNTSCNALYHNGCLYEWLSALPGKETTFPQIWGTCPNCEKTIQCTIPEEFQT